MRLSCDHVRHHIDDFVRGELDEVTAGRIREHLASCAGCSEEARIAGEIARSLKSLKALAPASLRRRVVERGSRRPIKSWHGAFRAMAAVFLIGAVIFLTSGGEKLFSPKLFEEFGTARKPMPAPAAREEISPEAPAMMDYSAPIEAAKEAEASTNSPAANETKRATSIEENVPRSLLKREARGGGGIAGEDRDQMAYEAAPSPAEFPAAEGSSAEYSSSKSLPDPAAPAGSKSATSAPTPSSSSSTVNYERSDVSSSSTPTRQFRSLESSDSSVVPSDTSQ